MSNTPAITITRLDLQRLERLLQRLHQAHPQRRVDGARHRLVLLRQRLAHAGSLLGEADRPRLVEARRRLLPALERRLAAAARRLDVLGARLVGLDPTGPLERGFVLALGEDGRPVTSARALPEGAGLDLRWKDGARRARLEGENS